MKEIRIGYLPDSEDTAERLRTKGYDVAEYDKVVPFDVLLYGGGMDNDPVAGIDPAAPLFMLNTKMLDDDEIDRQLHDRTYSRLFE